MIYAMSDIHGCIAEFDEALSLIDLSGNNMLILCGDYIHGYDSYSVLDRIIALQRRYGEDKVIALMGNHEEMVADGRWRIAEFDDETDYDDVRPASLLYHRYADFRSCGSMRGGRRAMGGNHRRLYLYREISCADG